MTDTHVLWSPASGTALRTAFADRITTKLEFTDLPTGALGYVGLGDAFVFNPEERTLIGAVWHDFNDGHVVSLPVDGGRATLIAPVRSNLVGEDPHIVLGANRMVYFETGKEAPFLLQRAASGAAAASPVETLATSEEPIEEVYLHGDELFFRGAGRHKYRMPADGTGERVPFGIPIPDEIACVDDTYAYFEYLPFVYGPDSSARPPSHPAGVYRVARTKLDERAYSAELVVKLEGRELFDVHFVCEPSHFVVMAHGPGNASSIYVVAR